MRARRLHSHARIGPRHDATNVTHGGFGVHFIHEMAPEVVKHNMRVGSQLPDDTADTPRNFSLVLLEYGYNDPSYYTPGDYTVALQSLILKIRGQGYNGPIALVGMPQPNIASEWKSKNWNEYLGAMRSTALAMKDVAFIDLSRSLPSYPNGGVWADTVHLNATGLEKMATLLNGVLRR